jgi:hypothetical protein
MNERDVFIAALQIETPARRRQYLDEAFGGDEALRRQVEELLQTHDRAGSFLQQPVLGPVAAAAFLDHPAQVPAADTASTRTLPPRPRLTETQAGATGAEPPSLEFLAPSQQPDELGRLGPFRVLRVLGAGGMGVVFLAEDSLLKRPVALKAMLPGLGASNAARQRFLREAQSAAAIKHDHIVTIHQVGEDRGNPFLAMELLEGEPLDRRLQREGKLPPAEVLRIGREIAEGLAAAHERGLIHRDIKPANIWLEGPRGRVKLLDFGLARAVAGTPQLTQQGMVVGTPSYMSPEQAGGQPVDARSDLFSLGTVLYRMAAGEEPFDRGDMIATLVAVVTEPARPPREVDPAVSPALSDLILRLLAKDPARRPAAAAEVAHALLEREQDAAGLVPAPGKPPGSTRTETTAVLERRAPSGRRRRWVMLAGGLGLAALVIGLLAALLSRSFHGRPDANRAAADQPTTAPAPPLPPNRPAPRVEPFALVGHGSQVQTLAFTADGKTLVSAEYWGGLFKFWDMDRRETTSEMTVVPGGQLQCFALDPKQHWLAVSPMSNVGQPHPGIRLFRFGEPLQVGLLKGHTDRVLQLAFLRDGRTLLSAGFDGSVRRWDVEKQQEDKPLPAGGPRIDCLNVWENGQGDPRLALAGSDPNGSPTGYVSLDNVMLPRFSAGNGVAAFSPDGTRLACSKTERMARAKESYVALWNVAGKTPAPLGELPEAPIASGLAFTPDGKHVVVMGNDHTRVYEAAGGKQVARVDHPEGGGALALSPDARWLAVGTVKGPIRVWHLPSLLPPPG